MANSRRVGKDESDESLNDEGERQNQSVLAPPPMKQRKGSFMMTFAMKKAAKTPKFRNKNVILSKKQVDKLNSMKPYQIAKNHTFKELEYIVDSLTRLYAQLYKYRDDIKLAKAEAAQVTVVSKSSDQSKKKSIKEGKRRKSRKRFTLSRKSLKRGSSAGTQAALPGRRGSVLNLIGKKSGKSDSPGLLTPAKTGATKKVSKTGSVNRTKSRKSGRRGGTSRRGSVLASAVRVRTSAIRSSVPNFAKLAARIKNIKSNPEDDLPVDKLKEYSSYAVENALEKSDRALKAHQRFKEKEKKRWKEWEDKEDEANTDCLVEMQGLIPNDLRFLKEEQIAERLDGNLYLARRFNRHKVFLLFNMTFDQLQSVHPADLKNRYHVSGLDLVELRALYAHTNGVKRPWRVKLRQKLFIQTEKADKGLLSEREERHPAYENKPDFQEERKPSVVAFMNRGSEPTVEKHRPSASLVAKELQKRYGLPELENKLVEQPTKSRPTKRINTSKRKPKKDKEVEAIKSIYLVKRSPDAPVDRNTLTESKRKVNSVNGKGERDTSDGDEIKRRPKDNIFSAFADSKNSSVNDSRRRKNRPLAHGEKKLEDVEKAKGKETDPQLENYFANREAEEEENVTEDIEFNEDEYKVKPNDQPQDLKRKQSELFVKAFEMINSDEVADNDEVFLKTLRSLSVFTASMSGDELDDELERYGGEESESEDPDATRANNFYLSSPPKRKPSEQEDELLDDVL